MIKKMTKNYKFQNLIYRLIIKLAVDNGVYKQKNIESKESLNVIIDYALNSTKSIFERRSFQSFVEEKLLHQK